VLPLQTTLSLIHLAPPTHLEDNHNHSHRPPISRPPSLKLGSAYTIGRPCISISYALHAQAAVLDILCHNPPKTAALSHEDNTAMIHDPVTPPNPLDDDYGGNDVDGRFQTALQSHDRVLKRMVHHPRLVVPYTVNHQVPTSYDSP